MSFQKTLSSFFNTKRDILVAFLLISCVLFVLTKDLLFFPGLIIHGDFISTLTTRKFIDIYFPTWTEYGIFDLNGFMRQAYLLIFYGPFFALNLPADIYFKFMIISTLALAGFSMYIFAREILGNYVEKEGLFICSFASAILYAFNPWVMNRISHRFLLTSYSLVPLIVMFFIKMLRHRRVDLKYGFLAAITFTLCSTAIHSIVFISLLLSLLYLYRLLFPPSVQKNQRKTITLNFALFLILYVSFNSYWILPLVSHSISRLPQPMYVFTVENLRLLSRRSSFLNTLRLISYWNPKVDYSFANSSLDSLWKTTSFLIPIICFSSLLLHKKERKVVYMALVVVAVIFLQSGTNNPIPFVYEEFCFSIPFVNKFSWLLRDPDKWGFLLNFIYSIMMGLASAGLMNKLPHLLRTTNQKNLKFQEKRMRTMNVLFGTLLVFLLFIYVAPTAHNYFGGPLKPVVVPNEFYSTNEWLEDDPFDIKVLWLPKLTGQGTTWAPDSLIGPFDAYSSAKPVAGISQLQSRYLYEYALHILLSNRTEVFGKYLTFVNVRYIIFHDSMGNGDLAGALISQKDVQIIKQDGIIYIFENRNESPHIYIPGSSYLVTGSGFEILNSLSFIESFNPTISCISFLDQRTIDGDHPNLSDNVILTPKANDSSLLSRKKIVIAPYEATFHSNPSTLWSKTAIHISSEEWCSYLKEIEIENWQFDYGKGLVFTWATPTMKENLTLNDNNLHEISKSVALEMSLKVAETDNYVFLIRYFQNQKGGEIGIQLDDMQYTMPTKHQLNTFSWKEIDTVRLEQGQHKIILTNIKGFNAVNLFALIPKQEYQKTQDQLEKNLQNKRTIYIFEAEKDLYYKNATKSSRYGGAASNGQILILNQSSTVWQNITILKPSQYRIATRSKGQIQIAIDNQTYTINSTRLNWNYVDPIYLDKGKHKIQITTPTNAELDVIYLFSTQNSNETLQIIFAAEQKPAEIINQTKINPTKYVVNVNATCSFTLAFAETYDPLWVAYVNGEKVSSTTLYGVINGFWINRTGQLSVTIEYEPQRWFYYGATISAGAFLACIAYSVWPWVRKRWKIVEFIKKRVKLLFRFSA